MLEVSENGENRKSIGGLLYLASALLLFLPSMVFLWEKSDRSPVRFRLAEDKLTLSHAKWLLLVSSFFTGAFLLLELALPVLSVLSGTGQVLIDLLLLCGYGSVLLLGYVQFRKSRLPTVPFGLFSGWVLNR